MCVRQVTTVRFGARTVTRLGESSREIGDVVKTRIAETVPEAQSLREYIAAG